MPQQLPRLIALEEHWIFPTLTSLPRFQDLYGFLLNDNQTLANALQDVSSGRIESMHKNSIDVQVVSHSPGLRTLEECRTANNELYKAMIAHTDRIAGFTVLPVAEPASCSEELTRCVKTLGFKGALVDHQTWKGTYFTSHEYDPMWQTFQDLDVPCYLHPTWLATHQIEALVPDGEVSKAAQKAITGSSWAWHSDTASHMLQLHATGVFDRFPKLKIVLGHFGEMIPFMLDRIELFSSRYDGFRRSFKEVWNENIWITTSGVWSLDPMATVLWNTSIDRIMFSIDYPLATYERGLQWFRDFADSGLVDEEGLEKIAHRNACKLLKL